MNHKTRHEYLLRSDLTWFRLIFISLFFIQFDSFSQNKVFIFIHPECPISQQYLHKIDELAHDFPQFQFNLIIPPKGISQKQIEDFKNEYSIKITINIDKRSLLIKQLGAKITPEVFVLNGKKAVLYSGMIDNWFYDLGKHRPEATEFYLRDALLSISKNEEIKVKKTVAIGCFIEK